MCDWLYELMVDEHASAWTPRADVRAKVDERLAEQGGRLASLVTATRRPDDAEARRNDPANEQGAKALMSMMAAGGSR